MQCSGRTSPPQPEGDRGIIVVLPQLEDKASAVEWMVGELAPRLTPKLFPDLEQGRWRRALSSPRCASCGASWPVYVDAPRRPRQGCRSASTPPEARVNGCSTCSTAPTTFSSPPSPARSARAVWKTSATSTPSWRPQTREPTDARISRSTTRSPLLLVEVKGITRPRPRESEALRVGNYIAPRMRSLKRHDIAGLTVINHERHVPPATRATEVFSSDVITAAEEDQAIGLIRSVDLYRPARGAVEYNWAPGVLRDRFWTPGLLDGRPEHHEELGRIAHVFGEPQVIAVELTASLRRGARVAVELPTHTVEFDADSLQQSRRDVDGAEAAEQVAIHVTEHFGELREGMQVLVARAPRVATAA